MRSAQIPTLKKVMTIKQDGGIDSKALAAFEAILSLKGGASRIRNLYYGLDPEGNVRYDSAEKLADLWVKVGCNIGRLVQEMQWQPDRVGPNGGRRRTVWRAIVKLRI